MMIKWEFGIRVLYIRGGSDSFAHAHDRGR